MAILLFSSLLFLVGFLILLSELGEGIFPFLESTKFGVFSVVCLFGFLGVNLGYFEIKHMSQVLKNLKQTDVRNIVPWSVVVKVLLMESLILGVLLGVGHVSSNDPQALVRTSFLLMMVGLGASIMFFILLVCSYFAKHYPQSS